MFQSTPVCVVTGGSLGIGLAVVERFAKNGYQVVNLDIRDFDKPVEQAQWMECDVTSESAVSDCITETLNRFGRIDVLVSNAGMHFSATIEDTSPKDFDRVFSLNVKGAYHAVRAVLPAMKQAKSGAIIIMASDQAIIGKRNSFAYNMSKAALASFNIRANAVCPGTIETPLYHNAIDKYVAASGADKAQVHAEEEAAQPLGRLGQPDEVAAFTYFLASDDAKFITGSLHSIDGGYTAQ